MRERGCMVSPVSSMVSPPSQLLHSRLLIRKAFFSIVAKTKDELDTDLQPGEGASCVVQRDGSFPYSFTLPVPYEGSTNPTAGFLTRHRGRWTALVPRCVADTMAFLNQSRTGPLYGSRCWLVSTLEVSRCLKCPLEDALGLSWAG